jgi:glutamate-1-semialdehyde 2,1-aminomutase
MKIEDFNQIYKFKTKKSNYLYKKSIKIFPGGISHNIRFFNPYPFFVKKARGKILTDVDNNSFTDYWMGHWALILGHSPKIISKAIANQVMNGTLYGTVNNLSVELGEIIQKIMPKAEMLRFASTGSEATMYAVRLARASSGKKFVAKIIGGWHGFNSTLLESVNYPFDSNEGIGFNPERNYIRSIPFNDLEKSLKILNYIKKDLACIIIEPILGGAGCIVPEKEYLQGLQEFAKKNDIILILDEIVTGFRLSINGAYRMFKLEPNLITLGKIAGGGLPIGIVCGEKEVLSLANPTGRSKELYCSIGGGTFSANPITMVSGLQTLTFLQKNRHDVYRKINNLGNFIRQELTKIFYEYKIKANVTGIGSLFHIHFLNDNLNKVGNATDAALCNKEKLKNFHFVLMAKYKIFFLPNKMGAISYVHNRQDLSKLIEATRSIMESRVLN